MDKKILKVNKISKSFGEKEVLKEVSFSLGFNQKIALVGNNGSGKTTLAKIIIGEEEKDDGSIEIFKNFRISYLPQEIDFDLLVQEYLGKSSEIFQRSGEFGFGEEIFQRKISYLSGGEKTKIFLIKISLEKLPIIILDEPTNNLDQDGLEYLEKIIQKSNSSFLIISHDRKFLDNTVSKIVELNEEHQTKIYDGNYSDYLKKKNEERRRQGELYIKNQKEKKKLEEELRRQIAKAS